MPSVEIPAPVGGWNARDALSAMEPTDAVELVNWVPGNGVVTGRGGSLVKIADVSGSNDSVETLLCYEGDAATRLIAAAGGTLWNVTNLATSTSIKTGFTSDRWQAGAFDNNLVLCNGADTPQVYNGTTATDINITSGPTPTDLVGVVPFKGRAIYWENSSASFWYAQAGSFQGDLTEFPLATFTQHGGVISMIVTWTRDSNDGVDDLLAIIFNTGETLIYQGDDPDNAQAWSMIGRWMIGRPINIRAHGRFNSTEIVGTQLAFMGLDEAMQNLPPPQAFGGRIIRAANMATAAYGANFGWQFFFYTTANLYLINVPLSDTESVQFVKNTNTGGWTKFTNWPARCFAMMDKRLYFGGADGALWMGDTNNNDPIQNAYSDNGSPIPFLATTAYQKFGEPGLKSQLTAARVVTTVFDRSALSLNAFFDYKERSLSPIAVPIEQAQGMWDVSFWDTDYWAGDDNDPLTTTANPTLRPITCTSGFAVALNVRYQAKIQNPQWYSTEFVYTPGGIV